MGIQGQWLAGSRAHLSHLTQPGAGVGVALPDLAEHEAGHRQAQARVTETMRHEHGPQKYVLL